MKVKHIGVIVLLCSMLALVACSHSHEWDISTGTCKDCDVACVHEWEESGLCKICGMSCEHRWDKETGVCRFCGETCEHESWAEGACTLCGAYCLHEIEHENSFYPICNICNTQCSHIFDEEGNCRYCDAETIFKWDNVPENYLQPCDEQGTIEVMKYTTHAYAAEKQYELNDLMIEKECHVYLPYGYDSSKQYNVLYIEHGWGMELDTFLYKTDLTTIADNMIKNGDCEPLIIVATTYHTDMPEYPVEDQLETVYTPAENLNYGAFLDEMREAIIPAVESKYSTFAGGNVSADNLMATRDHRAFAGYSFGSVMSVGMVGENLEYFSYFLSMHGASAVVANDVIATLTQERCDRYPIAYWYVGHGLGDSYIDKNNEMVKTLLNANCPGIEVGVNFHYLVMNNHLPHAEKNSMLHIYNALHVFFRTGLSENQALIAEGKLK